MKERRKEEKVKNRMKGNGEELKCEENYEKREEEEYKEEEIRRTIRKKRKWKWKRD